MGALSMVRIQLVTKRLTLGLTEAVRLPGRASPHRFVAVLETLLIAHSQQRSQRPQFLNEQPL